MTRITHRSIQESTLANLQRNLSAMAVTQEQLSTQKRINRPSDDPTGTVSVLSLRSDLRATEQHRRNADDGVAWLGTADTALQAVGERLSRAKTLALNAASTGAQSVAGLAAIALEIQGIRDTVLENANAQYLGRSVFAGTADSAVTTTPGSPPTYAWAPASTGTVERPIAPGTAVRVDTDGRAVFGEGEASVFALLDRIAEQARTADPLLSDSMAELDTHVATITTALSGVGARYARVDAARQSADDRNLALTTSLSEVESIDLPAAIVALQSQDVAYRAALGATAKVLQPSLLDFLR